jgi:hypothetical protein
MFEIEERIGELLPSQRSFIYAPEMFSAIAGGFGSGKTRAGITKGLILSAYFPGNRGIVGRYRGTDLEDTTKPVFFEVAPPSWIRSYNKQANVVTLRNDSQIIFRHIHDPKATGNTKTRRLGANLGWFFLDQMEELEIEHWNAMISRLRLPRARKRFGFGALNPNGHDWNHKMFFPTFRKWKPGEFHQVIRPAANVLGVAVNSEENRVSNGGFVDDSYFDSLLTNYPPEWVDRYIRCSFEDFTGKIYKDFAAGIGDSEYASVHNIDPFPIPSHWDLVVGIDVGGDSPWAVVPEYIDDYGNTIVVDGLVKPSLNTAEIANWIKTHLPWNDPKTTFVIDWENKLAMLELAEHGIHAKPAVKTVFPGILRTGGYFHINKQIPLPPWYKETQPASDYERFHRHGSPRTFVFKTNTTYRKDHDEYVWDPNKKNEPKKTDIKRFDTCDADRYVKMTRPLASALKPNPDPYASLRRIDPLSAKEWTAMDKRIAERQARQKGGGAVREATMEEIEVVNASRIGGKFDWND